MIFSRKISARKWLKCHLYFTNILLNFRDYINILIKFHQAHQFFIDYP
jgi:hypothetical protein